MATIADVARIAGVSLATVSHVVNDTRPVRPATREKVLDAITQTGYTQHAGARALRRARTDTVGLVVSDTGQPVFADMIRGVEHTARADGFTLLLANSAEDQALELASIRALRERRVDGLLLAQVSGSPHSLVERLRDENLPIVLIDRLAVPDIDQVGVENAGPMRSLVGHLIDRGHRRIALVAGDLDVPTLAERHDGYLEALRDVSVPVDPALIVLGSGRVDDTRAAVRTLLLGPDRPGAIVTASMLMAVGSLQAAQDCGLSIPGALAFATFDEPPYADLFSPRLTSVVQPAFDIGREGMRLLLRRIRRREAPARTIRLMPRIAHRESCGCPPGSVAVLEVHA